MLLFCYSVSHVSLFVTPWTVACQTPLSMGFSRQEYWSGLPSPSPGDLPDPGIRPTSPILAGRFFTFEPPGKSCQTAFFFFSHSQWINSTRKVCEVGTPSLQMWTLRCRDVCITGLEVVQLGFQQLMLQMIKTTSLKSPFTTSCAHTAPYMETTLPSHTDTEKFKRGQ